MGNGSGGACCSGSQENQRCCKNNSTMPSQSGAPVSKPLPSSEVMGVEPQPPPGINSLVISLVPENTDRNSHRNPSNSGKDEPSNTAGAQSETQVYKDGSTYVGQLINGQRQGLGKRSSQSGEYEGQWESDTQHGRGKQKWTDGRVYEGEFELGKFSGDGRMVWNTQKGLLVYEGQYKDDLKHGVGKFVWADGRTYEGEWCCGKRHGRGRYINARLETKVGYWLDDKFDRWEDDNVEILPTAETNGTIDETTAERAPTTS